MPKVGKTPRQPKVVSGEGYCRKCQKTMSLNNFYEATNPMLDSNGFMSICKKCCSDIYDMYFSINNNMEYSLQLTCQDLDVRFSKDVLTQTQSHIEKLISQCKKAEAVFGYYKSKLSSTGKANEKIDTFRYRDSEFLSEINDDKVNNNQNNDIDTEWIKYWGACKELWEYEFLEDELSRIQASFECPDYSMEMIMKDIALLNLDAEKIRRGILKNDLLKTIEARSKLMNDANMKPVQSTGAEASDQITFGTLIKKWENEKPVPTALDDEMKKYIDTYMVGHLAKMQGLNGEIVDKYQDSLKDFTIDFENIDKEDDDI